MRIDRKWKRIAAGGGGLAGTLLLLALEPALAKTAGEMGTHLASQGEGLGKAISVGCYIGGMAAGGLAAAKFMGNRASPQQHPLSHAFMALIVCGMLLFLPQTFENSGDSIFGTGSAKNAIGGTTAIGGGGTGGAGGGF